MGLPPASPRYKFMHTHSGDNSGSPAVPRRPPRQQLPPPSVRSRSLELLDQDEEEERKSAASATIVQARPPLPRPRSRSLDGLLDEDAKSSGSGSCDRLESYEQDRQKSRGYLTRNQEVTVETSTSEENPVPVPRIKTKLTECKSDGEDTRTCSNVKDEKEKEEIPPTRPPKPNRRSSSLEGPSSTISGKQCDEQEQHIEEHETTQEKLMRVDKDKNDEDDDNDDNDDDGDHDRSTMLKARSCGAGLDSDGSVSSSEYSGGRSTGPKKDPGSLLSLPAGAEPKRKRNFMDKCVNKVRSFMRK